MSVAASDSGAVAETGVLDQFGLDRTCVGIGHSLPLLP